MSHVPLLVFADDWGRHPSSCQHLIQHLLARHPVTWVNTIGTRKPRLDLATIRRGLGKLGQWIRPGPATAAQDAKANPHVVNPRMWPWFGSRLSRGLNRHLLTRALVPVIEQMPGPPVAVTTLPLMADLIGALPVRRWVYYCVDDFTEWPGYDGASLRKLERELITRVDTVIAVSQTLRERLRSSGRDSHLLTHGVDPDFWSSGRDGGSPLAGLPRPLVVFWGLLDRRMDLAFLRALSRRMTEGSIVLVGPQDNPDPEIAALPRVARVGQVPFAQLPAVAAEAAVLVMPYADLPVTRAMQPLKLKEYLCTGKPVVVRDLPSTREWADCLDLAASAEEFARLVLRRLAEGLPREQRQARDRLAEETWASKAARFAAWLEPAPAEPTVCAPSGGS